MVPSGAAGGGEQGPAFSVSMRLAFVPFSGYCKDTSVVLGEFSNRVDSKICILVYFCFVLGYCRYRVEQHSSTTGY